MLEAEAFDAPTLALCAAADLTEMELAPDDVSKLQRWISLVSAAAAKARKGAAAGLLGAPSEHRRTW